MPRPEDGESFPNLPGSRGKGKDRTLRLTSRDGFDRRFVRPRTRYEAEVEPIRQQSGSGTLRLDPAKGGKP